MTTFSLAPVGAAAYSQGREPLVAEVSRISAPIGATAMLAGCAAVAPTGACVNQVSTALCRRCRVENGAAQLVIYSKAWPQSGAVQVGCLCETRFFDASLVLCLADVCSLVDLGNPLVLEVPAYLAKLACLRSAVVGRQFYLLFGGHFGFHSVATRSAMAPGT